MATEISIKVSDELYQRAQRFAQHRHQHVTEALADYLEEHLPVDEAQMSPPALAHVRASDVVREQTAYRKLHPHLWRQIPGQYVAIHNGQLVDKDVDKRALLARIEAKYPAQFVLLRRVERTSEREYRFPSIRCVERN